MKILGVVLMSTFFLIPQSFAGPLTVSKVEGESLFLKPGEKDWHKLSAGTPLTLGDRISTGENAVVQFESSYGVVELSENTYILIKILPAGALGGSLGLELASGMVKAKSASDDGDVKIEIRTPNAVVTSSGFFSLWIYSLLGKIYTRVDAFEGEAWVRGGEHDREQLLSSGQHMTIGASRDLIPKEEPFVRGFNAFQIQPGTSGKGKAGHAGASSESAAAAGKPPFIQA